MQKKTLKKRKQYLKPSKPNKWSIKHCQSIKNFIKSKTKTSLLTIQKHIFGEQNLLFVLYFEEINFIF